jgi:hypothetical protein
VPPDGSKALLAELRRIVQELGLRGDDGGVSKEHPVERGLDRDRLLSEISREQIRLATLDRERELAATRLEALRQQLAADLDAAVLGGRPAPAVSSPGTPTTSQEKVALFRALFRGRVDVFPVRFESKKTGKAGYAPACANKFVRGVCELPRVKCGECPNQAFLAADDQAVLDHLRGRRVMGVYPLLPENTCWFLAADFDKASWMEDTAAFVEASRSVGVPVAVERSRSGNGAHAWLFFSAPVAASAARKVGCYLVTTAMARRHQISMESYDRLFPNQDTMPRGGFGNLIALPLQYEPRQSGHTIFVDDHFVAHPDQWAFLASVGRIAPSEINAIAQEATRSGRVLGVRVTEPDASDWDGPWARPPSGQLSRVPIAVPLPAAVRAVLAQRLFVDKSGLPSELVDQIKRLAAFQNPEFHKKQNLRLSTALTPRVIACAEELPQHVALPRGCRHELAELCTHHGVPLVIDDRRGDGAEARFQFQGELTAVQKQAARALLQHDIGIFVAPPGIGKTVLGTHVVAQRGRSTLVVVHRRPLLDQWVAQLSMFLGIGEKEVGQIGAGKRKPNGRLDVAMIQSLVRNGAVDDIVATYGHLIVDECHHVPAVSFERVLSEVRARYILGLTATPHRRDGHHPILAMQLGPVRYSVSPKSQTARRPFGHQLIVRETPFCLSSGAEGAGIQAIYETLAGDESRNQLILDDVISAVDGGRPRFCSPNGGIISSTSQKGCAASCAT